MGDGEQTTLAEWDGDDRADEDTDGGEEIDALRRELSRLMDTVDTLADSHEDLAHLVETHLPDADTGDADAGDTDTPDRVTSGRGFQ